MRLKPNLLTLITLLTIMLTIGAAQSRTAYDSDLLSQDRTNPTLGRIIDLSPHALFEDYREAAETPGLGNDREVTSTWHFRDLRTDSVDLGWVQMFGALTMPSTDQIADMTTDAAGNVYVTGTSDFKWKTMKYDVSGNLVWTVTYTEPGIVDTYGDGILVDDEGNIYVSGYRWGPFIDSDVLLIKYNSSAVEQWVAEYAGGGLNNDFPNDIEMDEEGNIFIGGYSYNENVNADFLTLKYDGEGNLVWDNIYNGDGWEDDWINDIALDDSGNVYVAGVVVGEFGGQDYGVKKYMSDGSEAWSYYFDGIFAADLATSIAVDTAYQAYVTGVSLDDNTYLDYYTVKLDTSGNEVWGIRWGVDGEGDSWASDIVVDSSLNVTVTGVSYGTVFGFDFVTVQWDSTGAESWVARWSSGLDGGYDEATSMILDDDASIIITGFTESDNGTDDISTVKYDTSGAELWSAQHHGGDGVIDVAFHLDLDATGAVYVGGVAATSENLENISILKYDVDGSEVWTTEYDGSGNSFDLGTTITTDGYSNAYVAGITFSPTSGADISILKYDSTGVLEWSRTYSNDFNTHDIPNHIMTDPAGDVIITGYSQGAAGDRDILTMKYSSDGDQLWVSTYDGPGNGDDEGIKMLVDGNGHIYVTGYSSGALTNNDYTTIKYDGSGNEIWSARYVGPNYGTDIAVDLVLDDDENLYVTGGSYRLGMNSDYATVKYDLFGAEEWVARYNGAINLDDYATAIDLDTQGNIYVTGYTVGASFNDDITTIKYTPAGNEVWVRDFDGEANFEDRGTHIAVDNRGGVVVSGTTYGLDSEQDLLTLKYDSAGDIQWTNIYDGSGNWEDDMRSMVRDGTGAIYVTGQTLSEVGSFDYTTLKYAEGGELLWEKHVTGDGYSYDDPADMVVDSRGTVWITGASHYLLLGSYDWSHTMTVQYLQNLYPVSTVPVLPLAYMLEQNYPNPFNPTTTLQYDVLAAGDVSLVIYNLQGQEIVSLESGYKQAGSYDLIWDARDQYGEAVSTGVYLCKFTTGEYTQTIKMLYLK